MRCTTLAAACVGGLATAAVLVWRRWGSPSRSRLGVPAEARVARRRDVTPLVVSSSVPPTGRMLLGRLAPGGPLLATEDRERHPMTGRRATAMQGDRGSVALIGPTRAGKTVLVLDTVTGGDAERLYARAGWQRVGVVPNYALMPDGALCGTTFFCKQLGAAD